MTMLTVAYEITALARSPFGGIAQACYHTLHQAVGNSDVSVCGLYRHGDPHTIGIPNLSARRWAWHSRLTAPRFDIVHALCHRMPAVRAKRTVYTIHDVWSLYSNPYQGREFQKRIGRRMRRELARADLVIADSNWTRQRLLSLDVIHADTCQVVPLGVSAPVEPLQPSADPEIRRLAGTNYVLFVGRLEIRKNIPHILEAVRPLHDVTLVLVGEPGFGYDDQVKPKLSQFPTHRLKRFSRIPAQDLTRLYRHATAALIPSWEEGFGLPILEAMVAGCPVITANCSSSAEIAEGAAILVDPQHPDQSCEALKHILGSPDERSKLAAAGKARAAQYTWPAYFGRLLEVYRMLLG